MPAAVPELAPWTGLPAGLETDRHAPVQVEGPWLRRGQGRDLLWARADFLKVKSLGLRPSGELGTPLCFKRLLSPRKGEHPQHPDLGF